MTAYNILNLKIITSKYSKSPGASWLFDFGAIVEIYSTSP